MFIREQQYFMEARESQERNRVPEWAHAEHLEMNVPLKELWTYASEGERRWIEDIDLQFKERPIPNFYNLAGKSSKVDVIAKDGDVISLEEGLDIKVISTPGHSADEISYLVDDVLFIGDAVPVKGDIPIMVDEQASRNTLKRIRMTRDVETYYPAWDHIYSKEEMKKKLESAEELLDMLKAAVRAIDNGMELSDLVDRVCEQLKMPMLKTNPLFARTIMSMRKG